MTIALISKCQTRNNKYLLAQYVKKIGIVPHITLNFREILQRWVSRWSNINWQILDTVWRNPFINRTHSAHFIPCVIVSEVLDKIPVGFKQEIIRSLQTKTLLINLMSYIANFSPGKKTHFCTTMINAALITLLNLQFLYEKHYNNMFCSSWYTRGGTKSRLLSNLS